MIRAYARTITLGAAMAAYCAFTIAWGTSTTAACIVAATVVITQYGADDWRDRYRRSRP